MNMLRLYHRFQPEHYDLYLDIDRAKKRISGSTTITGTAKEKSIAVHQKGLKIASVQVSDNEVPFKTDNDAEEIKIDLPRAGKINLTIKYTAPLTDTMMGIYPSYYEVKGEKKQIIGTQFETNFARQAFPCVDEPEAKATFSLALKFDEHPGEIAISNMPEAKVENGIHYFDTTLRMSTYLVAFAFGELQSKLTETKSGVKIGVFATKAHQANELNFPLQIAKRAIEFYEDFYQTKYPLPHSWQLALPDFSAGAMENWGLVTYREAYMLLDPDNASLASKQLVATVICHELAHQWFGDLVTMKWWNDLWLNESFANMMEYVAVDALEPKWKIWDLFQIMETPMALKRDATDGVQPIHVNVEKPADINSLFDPAIVYAKGARMLFMVRALIGDDALRSGLKVYFAAHKFGNATGDDLWLALGKASGRAGLSDIMHTWLDQPGYPVVTAYVENDQLMLTQQQFFIGEGNDKDRIWQIPLNSNYADAPQIFKYRKVTLGNYKQLRQRAGEPFRVNVGNNSHFIVQYDAVLLKDILDHTDELDAVSKMQILQDLHLLADGRQTSYADVVPFLVKFAESHAMVVNAVLYQTAHALRKFVTPDSDDEKNLRAFFDKLSARQVKRLGWVKRAGETNDDQLTRPYVLSASLYAKNQQTIADAHALFNQYQDQLNHLPADIRKYVLENEVKNYGSQTLFDQLLSAYVKSADPSYKNDLSLALTSTQNSEFIQEILNHFKDSAIIKPQDLRLWYQMLLANPAGQQAAWDWFRTNWNWLDQKVGGDMEFTTFVKVSADIFHTDQRLAEFKAFFTPKLNTPGLTREIKMDLKSITSRVKLIDAEKDALNKDVRNNL